MTVWHMSGAGNTFAVIDIRGQFVNLPALSKELCKLAASDGMIALDKSETADFRMRFYNRDGSRAAMCGNGSRCICRYAWEQGIAGSAMTFQTDIGIFAAQRISEDQYRIQMGSPTKVDLHRKPGIAFVEMGVPHAVREYTGDLWADAEALKSKFRALRFDPAFPQGANVNFYTRTDRQTVRVLTYERGVEDFTQACGTGCCAIAAALWASGALPFGNLFAKNRGGILQIAIQSLPNQGISLSLQGDARVLNILQL